MIKLSAVIIAFNEEKYIGRCLESVAEIADEVLVLDSFSTDNTRALCEKYGARFEQHHFDGYVAQKNLALQLATYDHVLALDADEALSEEAKADVRKAKENWTSDGYFFNRRNNYCGHWMRFTTWYPDRKLRLFDRRKATWKGLDPHDFIEMSPGSLVVRMGSQILHWTVGTKKEYLAKMDRFARISAQYYYDQGIRTGMTIAVIHSVWRWIREYFINLGILEGKAGWQVSGFSALFVWKKYTYLRQLYGNQQQH